MAATKCHTRSKQEAILEMWEAIQRVSKGMTRFQIIISNNKNVLQLQNKLQTIK